MGEDLKWHKVFPVALEYELKRQEERLSRYNCRLSSLLNQNMNDPKLEKDFRDQIDHATVEIHFLKFLIDLKTTDHCRLGRFPRGGRGAVRRTPQASSMMVSE